MSELGRDVELDSEGGSLIDREPDAYAVSVEVSKQAQQCVETFASTPEYT